MPKKAKKLIPSKHHKLMDKELKHLYESEECKKCDVLKTKLSKYHKRLKKEQDKEEDTTECRKLIGEVNSKLSVHKKCHYDFAVDDIKKIIQLAS